MLSNKAASGSQIMQSSYESNSDMGPKRRLPMRNATSTYKVQPRNLAAIYAMPIMPVLAGDMVGLWISGNDAARMTTAQHYNQTTFYMSNKYLQCD